MKKIIFACDGKEFPEAAFRFIQFLQEKEPQRVTGIFFNPVNYQELIPTTFAPDAGPILELSEAEEKSIQGCITRFEELCTRKGIEFRTHRESGLWTIDDIRKETRFADLLVTSSQRFCFDFGREQPNAYLEELLRNAECPVILVPENFDKITKIVIAYDGKKESTVALKQFAGLFPYLNSMETQIVYLKEEENDEIPDLEYLEEYAGIHFRNLTFSKLHFNAKKFFTVWAENEKNTLVVSGSYGRTGLSLLLRNNFVEELIHDHCVPLFIAHSY